MNSIRSIARRLSRFAAAATFAASCAVPASAGPSIVVDLKDGTVLSADDAFRRWYPASLSKLMTAYVAFRAIKAGEVTLQSPVTISKNAAKEPPSKMGYKPGSVLTLDNALKIIMVKSANDVATAIGESLAGSQAAFSQRMNAESARLGMTGSHWVNAHGLHSTEQYTTARDLALLASALRKEFPEYADYFHIEGIAAGQAKMPNHNNLIGRFEGADGMKTGYTCPAGWNVAASATRDGRTLLAVVIGEETIDERDDKAAELLTLGFSASPAGLPTLATLKASGTDLDVATDMRAQICTAEARKKRADELKKLGTPPPRSAYLADMTRPPVLVAVELGGATGPKSPFAAEEVEYANVPIPTPRPDYTPAAKAVAVQ